MEAGSVGIKFLAKASTSVSIGDSCWEERLDPTLGTSEVFRGVCKGCGVVVVCVNKSWQCGC